MPPPRIACWVATGLLGACACGFIACGESTPASSRVGPAAASATPVAVIPPRDANARASDVAAKALLAELAAVRTSAGFAAWVMEPAGAPQRHSRLRIELPAAADQPLRLSAAVGRDPSTGQASELGVEVRPQLGESPRGNELTQQIESAHVLALGASTWVLRPYDAGVEDFWRIPTPTSPGATSVYPNSASMLRHVAVTYELVLSQVAGLRLVDSVLELLDIDGTPRLRMLAPYAFDAQGKRWPLALSVLDCQVDSSPKAPWRRPVTPPGNDSCRVQVSFDAAAEFPVWVDPQWTATGSLAFGRTRALQLDYSAVGGVDALGEALASVERYDPVTGTWAMTGPLGAPRADAQDIGFPGEPLVVGGGVPAAERYDWATQTWEAAGATANRFGCGTRFSSMYTGLRHAVFVGAPDASGGPVQVEFQTSSGEWQVALADNPPSFREGATCHDFSEGGSGAMLWLGGREPGSGLQPTSTWILKPDPSFGAGMPLERVVWEPGPDVAEVYPRGVVGHASVAISGGWQILGGRGDDGAQLNGNTRIMQFGSVFRLAPEPQLPRAVSNAEALYTSDGLWLVGGVGALGEPLADVYLQDAADHRWRPQWSLLEARNGAKLAALVNDGVLAVGGEGVAGVLSSVEVFAGGLGSPCGKGDDCRTGHCSDGICCDEACNGPCETCSTAYAWPGVCGLVLAGEPTPRCTGETSGVCPATLSCGATGECMRQFGYADCGTSCSDGLETRRTCNAGSCQAALYSCGAYRCEGDQCGESCGDDGHCAPGYFCEAKKCVLGSQLCGECYGYVCDPIKRECDRSCRSDLNCLPADVCRELAVGKQCVPGSAEPVGACGCPGPHSGGPVPAFIGLGPLGLGLTWLRRRQRRRKPRRSALQH